VGKKGNSPPLPPKKTNPSVIRRPLFSPPGRHAEGGERFAFRLFFFFFFSFSGDSLRGCWADFFPFGSMITKRLTCPAPAVQGRSFPSFPFPREKWLKGGSFPLRQRIQGFIKVLSALPLLFFFGAFCLNLIALGQGSRPFSTTSLFLLCFFISFFLFIEGVGRGLSLFTLPFIDYLFSPPLPPPGGGYKKELALFTLSPSLPPSFICSSL